VLQLQLLETLVDVIQAPFNLTALTTYEKIDAIVLSFQSTVEGITKGFFA